MFSHVVVFWTDPANDRAADELIAGAKKFLAPIRASPFSRRKNGPEPSTRGRPIVSGRAQCRIRQQRGAGRLSVHPLHLEFVEKVFRPVCKKVVVYDFE